MLEALNDCMKIEEVTPPFCGPREALSRRGSGPPSVCRCRRCNRRRGRCAGRRSGPSPCGRPSRPHWPGCGAAPRAAPTPPSGAEAAVRSWAALWLWAALPDRGSTARRWQISTTKPKHPGEGCSGGCSGILLTSSGWFRSKRDTLLPLSWCMLTGISEISEFVILPTPPTPTSRSSLRSQNCATM